MLPPARPQISVIVPALNEEIALPATLAQLLAQPQVKECIVVDGGSSDATVSIVQRHKDPRVQLVHSAPGRGKQMNAGAAIASGDMLLFHHADTELPAAGLEELHLCCANPKVQWGGFRHQFSNPNWKLRFVSWLHNLRFRCSGVVYGDQSMFVRRTLFEQLGGFAEAPLEDLIFSDAALGVTQSHKLTSCVITESRKFVQMGELTALGQVIGIVLRYQYNRSFEHQRFFEPYR